MTPEDRQHLERAIALADANLRSGDGGPFGAVIVAEDRVLAAASNQVLRRNDPTAHAEVEAIRAACAATGTFHLIGATLYSSCEPCPMCLAAAHWARIGRIVFAASRADAAEIGFIDEELYRLFEHGDEDHDLPREYLPLESARRTMRAWTDSPLRQPY